MKKYFKGFTLIECIVALAVLGVGCLMMAQIYANIGMINRSNHTQNTSLAAQMQYVEKYTNAEAINVPYVENADKTNHVVNTSNNRYAKITRLKDDGTVTTDVYKYGCDIYVLYSRDKSDAKDTSAKDTDLRYKYMLGHVPTT